MEALVAALTAFVLITPIELPDKTFVATLVLATRYRPLAVWIGVVAAFGLQSLVAVAAGHLIAFLPEQPVRLVAAGLFLVGGAVLFRGARRAAADEQKQEREYQERIAVGSKTSLRAVMASFAVLFAAEWGDLSQLFTAGLVARGGHPMAVFVGSWAGLAVVSGAAVLLGTIVVRYVNLALLRYFGAAICALLAVLTVMTTIHW